MTNKNIEIEKNEQLFEVYKTFKDHFKYGASILGFNKTNDNYYEKGNTKVLYIINNDNFTEASDSETAQKSPWEGIDFGLMINSLVTKTFNDYTVDIKHKERELVYRINYLFNNDQFKNNYLLTTHYPLGMPDKELSPEEKALNKKLLAKQINISKPDYVFVLGNNKCIFGENIDTHPKNGNNDDKSNKTENIIAQIININDTTTTIYGINNCDIRNHDKIIKILSTYALNAK